MRCVRPRTARAFEATVPLSPRRAISGDKSSSAFAIPRSLIAWRLSWARGLHGGRFSISTIIESP